MQRVKQHHPTHLTTTPSRLTLAPLIRRYLKLGLQGVTFLFASGDAGVGNYPRPYGNGCLGPNNDIFNPTWPNNCPWITNVGATKVYPGKTVFEPESAVFDPAGPSYSIDYSSGGGFSNLYPIPAYQKSAVAKFFAEHDPPYPYYSGLVPVSDDVYEHPDVVGLVRSSGGVYNRIGRGIPDVSHRALRCVKKVKATDLLLLTRSPPMETMAPYTPQENSA